MFEYIFVRTFEEQTPMMNLRDDIPAGVVVFLVALPLCLGIALASDAPLMSGIIAGVIGGLVVSWASGSSLSVSGPAAGLATIVAAGIGDLGFEAFLVAVVLAGLLQIVLGVARAGFFAELFPISVIKGMLAAIGIILILKQIPHALGRDEDPEGDLSFWVPGTEENTFSEIFLAFQTASPGVILITVVGLIVLIVWEKPFISDKSWSRLLPGPLIAVALGVLMNEIYRLAVPSLYITPESGHLVQLPSFSSVSDLTSQLASPDWSVIGHGDVWMLAFTIMAVASIETLLCVEATDKLDPLKRTTPMNRELMAQGLGNTLSGLIGGLPMTAVIVRSSANIYAGGRTRISSFTHGVLLCGLVLSVPFLLNKIPLGTLAAVLLMVGYKLARISLFKKMWADGLDQFLPFIVTIVATVLTDLLIGVSVGFVVGVVMVFLTNFHSAIRAEEADGKLHVILDKDVSFLNKTRLKSILAGVPDGHSVFIDGSGATFIDHDIRDVIEDFIISAEHRNITVERARMAHRDHPLSFKKGA
ncbi:MAG: MFS superfamily sulfate permease-like transporter [Myxococcota bacterium]|jgi:MFS superfamily sulfate permease-like transporter